MTNGKEGTFLETCFRVTKGNLIQHWLKNDNERGQQPKIWRYAHFNSHHPFAQKRSVMMACLKKVHKMASDSQVLSSSGTQKVAEFKALQYPQKMLWAACTTMGVTTRDTAWFRVRDQIPFA